MKIAYQDYIAARGERGFPHCRAVDVVRSLKSPAPDDGLDLEFTYSGDHASVSINGLDVLVTILGDDGNDISWAAPTPGETRAYLSRLGMARGPAEEIDRAEQKDRAKHYAKLQESGLHEVLVKVTDASGAVLGRDAVCGVDLTGTWRQNEAHISELVTDMVSGILGDARRAAESETGAWFA